MQTLRELLETTPNVPIKIKTGSSRWLYAYYNDNKIIARLTKESDKFVQDMQQRLFNRVVQYNALDRILKDKLYDIKHSKGVNKEDKALRVKKAQDKYMKDKTLLPKVIDNQKAKIKAFVPFLDRRVKRVWNLPVMSLYENPKTIYVEIGGKEVGQYDDIHDYAKENKLTLRKEEKYWRTTLAHRDMPKPKEKGKLTMVGVQKGVKYEIVRDDNGVAIGLKKKEKGDK